MPEVIRTFFEIDSKTPSFELDNGDIKQPYFSECGNVCWFTDKEYEKYKKENVIEFEEKGMSNFQIAKKRLLNFLK